MGLSRKPVTTDVLDSPLLQWMQEIDERLGLAFGTSAQARFENKAIADIEQCQQGEQNGDPAVMADHDGGSTH